MRFILFSTTTYQFLIFFLQVSSYYKKSILIGVKALHLGYEFKCEVRAGEQFLFATHRFPMQSMITNVSAI